MAEQPRQHFNDNSCAICLDSCTYGTETNCGHSYCAECIRECLAQRNDLNGLPCPLCRRRITTLFPIYTPEENDTQEGQEHLDFIKAYNILHAPIADQATTVTDRPQRDVVTADRPTTARKMKMLTLALFALVFLLLPVNIISEERFGMLGLIDDAIVAFIIIFQAILMYRSFS